MKSVICTCLYFLPTSAGQYASIPGQYAREKINLLFNTNSKLIEREREIESERES